jgi:hypothetical protein
MSKPGGLLFCIAHGWGKECASETCRKSKQPTLQLVIEDLVCLVSTNLVWTKTVSANRAYMKEVEPAWDQYQFLVNSFYNML